MKNISFPSEWHPQHAVQLTWPHAQSDWSYLIDEVEKCFIQIATEIARQQLLIVVCSNTAHVKNKLASANLSNISFYEIESNDTWARDHGGITIFEDGNPLIYDFCFNGWGLKFAANHDNQITRQLYNAGAFEGYGYTNMNYFVFEGGSIESDGEGTLLTTEECLLSANRNDSFSKTKIENCLRRFFGAQKVLWLKNGYLAGDDTDSHIDTLARFCDKETIAYVKCNNTNDEHYPALLKMEEELRGFRQRNGEAYKLLPLPLPTPVYDPDDGHRLPATYANFLIINKAVLLPVYNVDTDQAAIETLKKAFPNREIVPIDCSVLIRQHGSLHCISMQYPETKI